MMTTPVTAVPYFDEAGDGDTTVLMLHGIGGGRQAFAAQLSTLAAAGHRAVALDMPGYGRSATVEPYDFATLAAECIELIDVLDAGSLVVVGHSMGGMVAQEIVARAPARVLERLRGLVLAGTSAAFGKADGEWQRRFVAERSAPLDAGRTMRELATALVPTMVAKDARAEAVATAVDVMARVPPRTYRLALAALVGFDRRADLAAIRVPTLLVAGDEDAAAPTAVMRGMHERIAGSSFVELARTGHLMNLERPDAFDAALLAFLRDRVPSS